MGQRNSISRRYTKKNNKPLTSANTQNVINALSSSQCITPTTTSSTCLYPRQPSSTSTITSSQKYRYINGRQFHNVADSVYILPNDYEELDRISMQHFLYKAIWEGNFKAPIHRKLMAGDREVLDVGCGPGPWVMEMAMTYPLSNFTGIDISPVQPHEIKPRNSKFYEMNVLSLSFKDGAFDFCHHRSMALCFSKAQYAEKVIPELLRVTKQGGILEIMEVDLVFTNPGPLMKSMMSPYQQFLEQRGMDLYPGARIKEYLEKSGQLKDISYEVIEIPMGSSHGKLAKLMADNYATASKGQGSFFAPFLKMSNEELDSIVDRIFEVEVDEYNTCVKAHRPHQLHIAGRLYIQFPEVEPLKAKLIEVSIGHNKILKLVVYTMPTPKHIQPNNATSKIKLYEKITSMNLPFQLLLPDDLPLSMNLEIGRIYYNLNIKIERKRNLWKFQGSKMSVTYMCLITRYSPMPMPAPVRWTEWDDPKAWKRGLGYDISMNYHTYGPGNPIIVKLALKFLKLDLKVKEERRILGNQFPEIWDARNEWSYALKIDALEGEVNWTTERHHIILMCIIKLRLGLEFLDQKMLIWKESQY
ncbi:5245_t:CDS:2 [Ambispora gerdemannii]|uniref:5245_t:CDS:1 n=1 Tax=Ambispora gerdemannii TaxID=144530 RepID=A0A9N9F636_9GLOM|nr:5245_t:CDS:2 [Ambispora gerdemannii]